MPLALVGSFDDPACFDDTLAVDPELVQPASNHIQISLRVTAPSSLTSALYVHSATKLPCSMSSYLLAI